MKDSNGFFVLLCILYNSYKYFRFNAYWLNEWERCVILEFSSYVLGQEMEYIRGLLSDPYPLCIGVVCAH
jgi:hypothetical protein